MLIELNQVLIAIVLLLLLSNQNKPYGVAITGIKSDEPNLVRIQIHTADQEVAEITESGTRPSSNLMNLNVILYDVEIGVTYNLYQFTDPKIIPTHSYNDFYTKHTDKIINRSIIPDSSPYTIPMTINSSDIAIFRCVPDNKYPIIPFRTIAQKQQWNTNFGYCGETSFIAAAMFNGMYMSQYDLRKYISISGTQSNQEDQLLLGEPNEIKAANIFKFTYERWSDSTMYKNSTSTSTFINWANQYTSTNIPVVSAVYLKSTLIEDGEDANDEYDHIISLVECNPNTIKLCDNFLTKSPESTERTFNLTPDTIIYTYQLPTFIRNRDDALDSSSVYSLPLSDSTTGIVNYGIALTGIVSSEPKLIRIQITTSDYEINEMEEGENEPRPIPNTMHLVLHLYNLNPNETYYLYRYMLPELVPTSHFNSSYTNYVSNTNSNKISRTTLNYPSFSMDRQLSVTIQSNEIALYRCVPSTAP